MAKSVLNKGFLLIEVMVSVAIYTFFIGFLSLFFLTFTRNTTKLVGFSQELNNARNLFEEILISQVIPMQSEKDKIKFFSDIYSENLTKVTYQINKRKLFLYVYHEN